MRGYRKGFSSALPSHTENLKKVLDKKRFAGAVLMDLSKAFDTINHDLLIAKLYAHGFNKGSLKVLHSFLSNRWYRTNIKISCVQIRKYSSNHSLIIAL